MKRIFSTLAFLIALSVLSFAQGDQNDAPIYKTIKTDYCNDNSGTLTGFEKIQTFRVGDSQPVLSFLLDAEGNVLTTAPVGGTTTIGKCSASVEYYSYNSELYCDNGTQYYEIVKTMRSAAGVETYTVVNITKAGATYTPTGNEVAGACEVAVAEVESTVSRTTETATGTLNATTYAKLVIYNIGLSDGTITVGTGAAEPLKPGENYSFEAWMHPITKSWMLNNVTAWDATGTEFRLITTLK